MSPHYEAKLNKIKRIVELAEVLDYQYHKASVGDFEELEYERVATMQLLEDKIIDIVRNEMGLKAKG